MNGAHVCKVDKSAVSGSVVSCTCGYAVGPLEQAHAVAVASEHRKIHTAEREAARHRASRAAKRSAASSASDD